LFPSSKSTPLAAQIQSSNFDSLEPKYPCNKASSIRSDITTGDSGALWRTHLQEAAPIYARLDQVSGIPVSDTAGWHTSFDQWVENHFSSTKK